MHIRQVIYTTMHIRLQYYAYPASDLHNNAYPTSDMHNNAYPATKLCISVYKAMNIRLQMIYETMHIWLQMIYKNMHIRPNDVDILTTYLLGDLRTTWPPCDELPQVAAILRHGLLDGVPSMFEGLWFTVTDDRIGVGCKMLMFMEPYVNVPTKGCALLLRVVERIKASGQPCIAQ